VRRSCYIVKYDLEEMRDVVGVEVKEWEVGVRKKMAEVVEVNWMFCVRVRVGLVFSFLSVLCRM